uniref:Uncharacterized protein n=1 Tax=Anguilla anguilla TaxID=7936 RepID=A0A0E9UDW4_ANGAN
MRTRTFSLEKGQDTASHKKHWKTSPNKKYLQLRPLNPTDSQPIASQAPRF